MIGYLFSTGGDPSHGGYLLMALASDIAGTAMATYYIFFQ